MPDTHDELAPLERRVEEARQCVIEAQNGGRDADVRCATAAFDEAVAQRNHAQLRMYRLNRMAQTRQRRARR